MIESLVRKTVLDFKAYSSARDEFTGVDYVFLDANENPNDEELNRLNRYPDPYQRTLKKRLSEVKEVPSENIFLGNGSDEVLDLIYRVFCEAFKDEVIICPPTYGMYSVLARLNEAALIEIPLKPDFQLDINEILSRKEAKILFLCSPINPIGSSLGQKDLERVIKEFRGIVVLDEAYIDFANHESWSKRIHEFPNLIITQTFSKAWGLAGIRLGLAICSEEIIGYLNRIKPPYNINTTTQQMALDALNHNYRTSTWVREIISERERLKGVLENFSIVDYIFPSDSNFLLVRFKDSKKVYDRMLGKGIVLRDRNKELYCESSLRLTIGTEKENDRLLLELERLDNNK
ncbi:MAG: histidinol-phosphate transaminase [Bacteroidota bacterium]